MRIIAIKININKATEKGFAKLTVQPKPVLLGGNKRLSCLL
jgi:hypothetical protein